MPSPKLQALVDRFVADLHALFVEEAGEALRSTLGGAAGRPNGRRAAAGRGARAGRRSSEEIAKQAEKVFAVIKATPELNSEAIAAETGFSTAELVAPLKRLLDDKKIAKKGAARGTRYHAK
jgi:hypothetical protein